MATDIQVTRTCNLILYLLIFVSIPAIVNSAAVLNSFSVLEQNCDQKSCVYLLSVRGDKFLGHFNWRLTSKEDPRGDICDLIYPDYEIREVESSSIQTIIKVSLPRRYGKIYFCLREPEGGTAGFGSKWVHQGAELFLEQKNDVPPFNRIELQNKSQNKPELIVNRAPQGFNTRNNFVDVNDPSLAQSPNSVSRQKNSQRKQNFKSAPSRLYPIDLSHDVDVNNSSLAQSPNSVQNKSQKKQELIVNRAPQGFNTRNNLSHDFDVNDPSLAQPPNSVSRRKNSQRKQNFKSAPSRLNPIDLSHDVDVNYPPPAQPPKERNDKELLSKTKYDIIRVARRKREILNLKDNNSLKINFINKNIQTIPNNINNINENLTKIVNEDETLKNNQVINEFKTEDEESRSNLRKRQFDNHSQEPVQVFPITMFSKIRLGRQVTHPGFTGEVEGVEKAPGDVSVTRQALPVVAIEGLRIEDSVKDPVVTEGVPSVLTGTPVTLRLFGPSLSDRTVIAFTRDELAYKQTCKYFLKGEYQAVKGSVTGFSALFKFTAPEVVSGSRLYVCAKTLLSSTADISKDTGTYYAMGSESYKSFATHDHMLPLWATILLIGLTLCFSSLFSGLNLGLMALDRTQLKIIANTGTENERKYARTIMPVREKGNYLLCSILLGNVLVNSIFTILLDELTSGLFAVIFATLAIVLIGEITPQAVCSRHGLFIGSKTIIFTKVTMALTAPLAYPVSKLLDYFLGEEIGNVYNRERLQELIKTTTADLDKDEVNIISGTLDLRKKKVSEIMTRLEDVFMLPITAILDFETMSEIVKSGYSRIPVYENERCNIVTVLFIKDLAFVDPDDNTPLRTLCQYYQNPCNFVFEDVTLDVMFRQFKEGHKGHMAFVHRINTEGEGDPFYETTGLFTLEDVIEEMIQAEIVDETDVFVDNRSGRRRKHIQHKMQDFAAFAERHENQQVHISPQLTLATFQFLSSSVPAFEPNVISETVLRRLLKQDVIQFIRIKDKDSIHYIYQAGKAVDYFVLILEGRVEVTVGRENLVFEAGPFTYFGVQALTQNVNTVEQLSPEHSLDNVKVDTTTRFTFVPDYSVRAIADTYCLTVKRALYLAAKRATMMEKGALSRGIINDQFDTDIDKNDPFRNHAFSISEQSTSAAARIDTTTASDPQLLQSVEDGASFSADQKTPSRQISPNPPISPVASKSRPLPPLASPEPHSSDHYQPPCEADEQEKLLQ